MKSDCLKELIICLLVIQQVVRTVSRRDLGSIAGKWKIKYGLQQDIPMVRVATNVAVNIPLEIYDIERPAQLEKYMFFQFAIEDTKIASVEKRVNLSDVEGSSWQGDITVKGHYFGYTKLFVTLNDLLTYSIEKSNQTLDVRVVRSDRVDVNIFTYSAIAITLLMFVNLGTVLDLKRLRLIFIRPVGPLLGFCSRYIVMPGLAIGLGASIFKYNTSLQLALLFTAISPSGGIANICNVFLKGNINLSLATTTLNSISALGMLPLWIHFMGPVLYRDSSFNLPFVVLAVGCIGLLMALTLGVLLRIFIANTTHFIFRCLKPVSLFLSLCLVVATVAINAFAFKEITTTIFLASLFLPVFGYIISFTLSKVKRRSVTDAMTIGIETGVLNMTLPIVLLECTVEQPMSDMLTIVPILSALISLCLVVIFYTMTRIFGWNTKLDPDAYDEAAILAE